MPKRIGNRIYYTIPEAVEYINSRVSPRLRISIHTFYTWIKRGKVRVREYQNRLYVRKTALTQIISYLKNLGKRKHWKVR